jgi:hypothetical protein
MVSEADSSATRQDREAFRRTRLWRSSLGEAADGDGFADERARLREAYFGVRRKASLLAGEISRDLPNFTRHDESHMDALWDLADLIGGPAVSLTPGEAFVFGGAVLIHDLGLAVAAYPGGAQGLESESEWQDGLVAVLASRLGRRASESEVAGADEAARREATQRALVTLHARRAEQLGLASWGQGQPGGTQFLIDDVEIREEYGSVIGRIAHSHWWAVSELQGSFGVDLGAPRWLPRHWTVDPLKLACLLRAADATHLDARRAPLFLMALRSPDGASRSHWAFQARLHQPRLENDRLVFDSNHRFPVAEADAWWLCFDMLARADRELRDVDSLLADKGRIRFAARAVAGTEDPSRFAELVATDGWTPVDTRIRVGNVARLVRELGGEQLYGVDPSVPLRELIQNANDAVRARRVLEGRNADWGEVHVRLGRDTNGDWIEVDDTGLGMSADVLTGPLLDFGTSYWGSDLMFRELPRLYSRGFHSTGTYGIGFFSVFMWGDHVSVTTRRLNAGSDGTLVMEFQRGLGARPVLRKALPSEQHLGPGTAIRVWLSRQARDRGGVLERRGRSPGWRLVDLCAWLCPCADVNVYAREYDEPDALAVGARDWRGIDGADLLRRVWECDAEERAAVEARAAQFAGNLRELVDSTGQVVGRACVSPGIPAVPGYGGAVTVGGLRAVGTLGLLGVLDGTAIRATRDAALPVASPQVVAAWASEQAGLLATMGLSDDEQLVCASIICRLGGDSGPLPLVMTHAGLLNAERIVEVARALDSVHILEEMRLNMACGSLKPYLLRDDVMVWHGGPVGVLRLESRTLDWPTPYFETLEVGDQEVWVHPAAVHRLLCTAWQCSLEHLIEASARDGHYGFVNTDVGEFDGAPLVLPALTLRRPR